MNPQITIGRRKIGIEHPTYFIADIAANHDGDLSRAKDLIGLCAEAGADAAKFQNFSAHTIVSDYGFGKLKMGLSHQAKWKKSVFEIYKKAELPLEWALELKEACDYAGIDYFTAPYDLDFIPRLSEYVSAWKIGSGDITWHELIKLIASDDKAVFLATGASNMNEVRAAMELIIRASANVVLMQCNTNYTGTIENFKYVSLNVLKNYAREFPNTVLGLSDHTPGCSTVLGAVALGARAVEKHFTDDVSREGPDHGFSMSPMTWQEMVQRTRELEFSLGSEIKEIMENEKETAIVQRRALRSTRSIRKGEEVARRDLIALRPCPTHALAPYRQDELVGRVIKRDMEAGEAFLEDDVG
jgi:sialic acid synthase SpsE